jgi:hypothetical protein
VIRTEVDVTRRSDREGSRATVRAEAWRQVDAARARQWALETIGEEAWLLDDRLVAFKRGCCGSPDTSLVFSLETGTFLYSTNGRENGERAARRGDRTAAVQSVWASVVPTVERGFQALVTYASNTEVIQHVGIRVAPSLIDREVTTDGRTEKIHDYAIDYVQSVAWAEDAGAPQLRVLVGDTLEVRIPLTDDWLDVGRAVLPAGVTLENRAVAFDPAIIRTGATVRPPRH